MSKENDRLFDRILFVCFCTAVCFLCYIIGVASVKWKISPYPALENAFQAGKAVVEKLRPTDPFDSSFFHETSHEQTGVILHDDTQYFDGFTLFSYGLDQKAVLISMDGDIVHQWHLPFSAVWPDPPHINLPVDDAMINLIVPYLYKNGDILGIYATDKDTPYGYGIVKMDKDSNLIWKYPGRAHHDADVDKKGQVYVLTHEMRKENIPGVNVKPPVMDDYIVILSKDGKEIRKVSITEAFKQSEFSGTLGNLHSWDLWHANNIEVLDEDHAGAFPFFKKGCVLISMKSVGGIAVIDLEIGKVIWAVKGPWIGQHDPDFLKNGNLLIFDNKGYFGMGGRSRVIEFNPLTLETRWEYSGTRENVYTGRIFEVTDEKKIVWEYCIPHRVPERDNLTAVVLRALRFKADELNFLGI